MMARNHLLAVKSAPFSYTPDNYKRKILILGDSTAVGTGAERNNDSIAGRLAHDFHDSAIINLGVDGAVTRDVISQLKKVKGGMFDMILISVGGNDAWKGGSLRKLQNDLSLILDMAKQMVGNRVILLLYGNMGFAPFFPFFIRGVFSRRMTKIQEVFRSVAAQKSVPCVDLFTKEKGNPFLTNSKKFFAKDKIHPSSEGYRIWYNRMWRELVTLGNFSRKK